MVDVVLRLFPPWARLRARHFLIAVNLTVLVVVVANAELQGLGFEVAQNWVIISSCLSQSSLLWKLARRPQAVVVHLSLQSVGMLAACHFLRLLEPPPAFWAREEGEQAGQWTPLATLLPLGSLFIFALAVRERHRYAAREPEGAEAAFELASSGFGSELLGRLFDGPRWGALCRRPPGSWLIPAVGLMLLPAGALLAGLLLEYIEALLGSGAEPPSRVVRRLVHWGHALEAVALLPQLRVLLALRREGKGVVVPPDLKYWLVSLAIGHFFAFGTALADSFAPHGAGSRALALACGEGLNAAVLGELLVAHACAKVRGDKQLVLPA